jgi:acetyl-CoA synthetase
MLRNLVGKSLYQRSFRLPSVTSSVLSASSLLRNFSSFDQYETKYQRSIENPDAFWGDVASELKWAKNFDTVQNHDLKQGLISWFEGGQLNACENCVDRHVPTRGDQVALLWESDEVGVGSSITYKELQAEVCRLANVLKSRGVTKGDRVCIYMPMTPYVVYAMLACARLGAVHTVVFAGFSADALASRMMDANCRVLLTADEGVRGGRTIPLRQTCAEAIAQCPEGFVHTVITQRRTGNMEHVADTDLIMQDAMLKERPYCPITYVDSEDYLFLLYTSGSTGKPKGLAHCTAGYLAHTSLSHKEVFDIQDGDIYGCVADVGWITGHSYIVYGPLCNGATTMLFESIPTYPDASRYWDLVERHKLTQLYTAPTAIRLIMKSGDAPVTKHDRSSLRVIGSVGEPINADAYNWYNNVVGENRCSVVDTWWQTETGGIMMTPLPGDTVKKPGFATRPFYGVEPVLVDKDGKDIEGNDVSGLLCIRHPTPAMARTVLADHDRYVKPSWSEWDDHDLYFTGDGARRDADGHYFITGRVDDVINVSGHRVGTAEIESAIVDNMPSVVEAAVVGFPHEIKGTGIYAYVIFDDSSEAKDPAAEVRAAVRRSVGPFAMPDHVHITDNLPKTRSGKIMRRILRKVAENDYGELGDLSTLNEPAVVDVIIEGHKRLIGQ